MRKNLIRAVTLLMIVLSCVAALAGCGAAPTQAESPTIPSQDIASTAEETASVTQETQNIPKNPEQTESILPLSENRIRIFCGEATATFQLYDTTAAQQLYDQLPLTLKTENFRNAQWMFYPPEKLSVTASEAYHDGKKGELSYYEPWGDAFVLYEDFYARDEMHRLGICLSGLDALAQMDGTITVEREVEPAQAVQIQVEVNGHTIVYQLNNSSAARSLYDQLPLTLEVQDYSSNEKIYYLPKALDTSETPLANATTGTLAYFAPWGDVVMFYDDFGSYSGLYELGQVVSGEEYIASMSGSITITKK